MKFNKKILAGMVVVAAVGTGLVYANGGDMRIAHDYFAGHTHDADGSHVKGTHGAPSHSGGLDKNGCHNASVPYHCH